MASTFYGSEVTINNGLANKAENSDLTTLQSAVENIWNPEGLPSGFNSTDRKAMASLKNGWYWHNAGDGTKNFPTDTGFMVKFAHDTDFCALYFRQPQGAIYRISGNYQAIFGWTAIYTP